MNNLFSRDNPKLTQGGYAAFAVTLIIMIVLSLIVLGFASNARSEQRNALDNQLSTAAYYAAESGINDAYSIITATEQQSGDNPSSIIPQTTNCTTANNNQNVYITSSGSNELSANSAYSCLLVNPEPDSLEYRPVLSGEGETIPVQTDLTTNPTTTISTVTINWQDANPPLPQNIDFGQCPAVGQFPPESSGSDAGAYSTECAASVLQIDITPSRDPNAYQSATSLLNATQTVYLEPELTASSDTTVANGKVYGAACSTSPPRGYVFSCVATLTMSGPAETGYYFHVTPYYQADNLTICASATVTSPACSSPIPLYGAQALIDSTGRASDELKRIQERICINTVCDNNAPVNALQTTTNICKYFGDRPNVVTSEDTSTSGCPLPTQ